MKFSAFRFRSLTLPASMRRPVGVKKNLRPSTRGMAQGGGSPLVGGTHLPRLPLGERERGIGMIILSPCCHRPTLSSAILPYLSSASPIRPASIRTLVGAFRSGASWCPSFEKRVLPSQCRTEPLWSESSFCRKRAVTEPGDCGLTQNSFLGGLPFPLGRLAIAQRLIAFASDPQAVQQNA